MLVFQALLVKLKLVVNASAVTYRMYVYLVFIRLCNTHLHFLVAPLFSLINTLP